MNEENKKPETGSEQEHTGEQAAVKQPVKRRKRRKKRYLMRRKGLLLIVAVLLIAALGAKLFSDHHTSTSYSVVSTVAREDSSVLQYELFADGVLRFSNDGVSLTDASGTAIWNETYDMNTPTADIADKTLVIYDKKGNLMEIFNEKGLIGSIGTDLPILKARVSSQGMIAAILEDGDTTWINFYSSSGETIATGKTRIDSPGYPVDIDVSENGELLMVSYLYVDGNTPTSYVAFYNFGSAGQNQMDNMVSGYTYANVMVPQVSFLSSSVSAAVRDDGLTLYNGTQIPAEGLTITEETEIISSFICSEGVGIVVKNTSEDSDENGYTMKIYNLKGKLSTKKNFQVDYTSLTVSDNQIILYNDRQVSIFTMNGNEKFHGTIEEGMIQNICKVGHNRYLVVTDSNIETIKLK